MAIGYRSVLGSTGGLVVDSLTITSPATKTTYLEGQTIDTTGLAVTAVAGSLSGDVTADCTITPQVLTNVGTQTITIAYGGQTTSYTVTVEQITLSITSQPTKTAYVQGDALDLTGLVVTATGGGTTTDVTSQCTFSPADGSTLSTTGSVTVTATLGEKSVTTSVSVYAVTAIAITTPPTKTSYKQNEQLDLTGIVVTATASALTKDVTADCTFSPADGTTLTTEGTFTLTASYLTFTATTTYKVKNVSIYGVLWDGSSSSAWTRTDEAASFTDPQPYYSGMSGTPSSPFDACAPWSGMEIVDDTDAGKLVKIPKFWYKWTRSGSSMKLQIADAEETGFHVSPAHADRGDGSGERDYVYVGRYHCGSSNFKSVSGTTPKVATTRSNFRTGIHNLGSKIWQYDFAMWWTINMLYLVEFADWNSQAKIGGGCSETTATSSAVYNMGYTDSMPYHTGTTSNSIGATVYGGTQYRYIEGLWDNCTDWCDGIYFSTTDVYAINNPADFSDTTGGTKVGTRPSSTGWITTWNDPSAVSGYEYALFPSAVNDNLDGSTYICDRYYYNASGVVLDVGGDYNQGQNLGAFFLYSSGQASYQKFSIGSRLQKLP